MTFDPKSTVFNRGVNYRLNVEIPAQLNSYSISPYVWDDAVDEFNKRLDKRQRVSKHIGDIKIDILRLVKNGGNAVLWVCAKTNDLENLEKVKFILKGEVIFAENSDVDVDKVIIQNILFEKDEGIFEDKS